LREALCLCGELKRLATKTRVVLLMHAREREKPSNTGRLAILSLPNSEVRYRGVLDKTPLSLEGLMDESHETWMLHLSDQSEELTPELVAGLKKPVRLLVPDGTWSQASKLGSKLAKTLGAKHVKLRADVPTRYKLRAEHHPDGMSTLEAIARALGVLEGPEVRAELERIFQIMNDRELFTRGELAAKDVFGGLPKKR
jgi:DTW domain-containing protein YfiP